MTAMQVFMWALFGGAFFELLHWAGLKKEEHFEVYAGSKVYWVITVLIITFGAIFAVAVSQSGTLLTPLTAIITGYSAPSIIQKLAKASPRGPRAGNAVGASPRPGIFRFLIG